VIGDFSVGPVRITKRPKHTVIEGKGITVEIALNRQRTGWVVTATSHRGDKIHELEAVAATIRMLEKLAVLSKKDETKA
jgi:hypothetical protein